MHQWQKFGENLSIDAGDIVETWKSGMHSVMPWPWTLTFWPQNLISSSLSQGAPVTKVWRKSINRYWRYRGNIKLGLPRESRTHGRTHATSLMCAAFCGQTDVVHALVSAGADVNIQSNDGYCALGIASRQGHTEVVNLSLDIKAQTERQQRWRWR